MRLFTAEPSTLEIRDAEICASTERHDFETFAKHLQDAAMYIYRQGQRLPYAKVSALLLMWEEDSSVEADLSSLERTLHDRYHFHTERWKIPTVADPGALLSSRISKFVGPSNLDHLSIIYYIGSGQTGLDNQLYWSCFFFRNVIAAYASDAGPRDPSKRSFTSFLVESLQNLGTGRPFSTQHLYDDIIAIQQSYERHYPTQMDFSTLGQPPPAISHVPLFLALTPNKSTIDLSLMPRRHGSSKIQNGGGGNLSQSAGDDMDSIRDTPVISPAAVADAVFNEPLIPAQT
ncbi:hypothetical protein SEPCBS119000_005818 [Sporothrix epigloea]|uniref:Uncharacterized protein n=1 Tax=Sporothrix epigloea TaxID=1892477 RepID=A0ABP0DZN6_9PEZI